MLPDISFMLKQWFGIDVNLPFKTFGLLLALSIFTAAYVLYVELKRKEKEGLLPSVKTTFKTGAPASLSDLLMYALLGFVIGFKGVYGIWHYASCTVDPQSFLTSGQGNLVAGVVLAIAVGGYRYYDKKRKETHPPVIKVEMVKPHFLAGDITLVAAISGVIGAKVFDAIENMHDLLQHPIETLVSFSGLAFYGGLIFGTIAVVVYLIRKKLPILHFADAIAPTLIIGYAVGRIGCQLSGDGDWGIVNFKPKPFSWLPDWAWAYRYPHNVVGEGVQIPGYAGPYPTQLMHPVYPTPLYEIIMGFAIFGILWALRKQLKVPGLLFCIYLILNGIERFFIEIIRVNPHYTVLGYSLSQAQIIAIGLVLTGIIGIPVVNRLALHTARVAPRTNIDDNMASIPAADAITDKPTDTPPTA